MASALTQYSREQEQSVLGYLETFRPNVLNEIRKQAFFQETGRIIILHCAPASARRDRSHGFGVAIQFIL